MAALTGKVDLLFWGYNKKGKSHSLVELLLFKSRYKSAAFAESAPIRLERGVSPLHPSKGSA